MVTSLEWCFEDKRDNVSEVLGTEQGLPPGSGQLFLQGLEGKSPGEASRRRERSPEERSQEASEGLALLPVLGGGGRALPFSCSPGVGWDGEPGLAWAAAQRPCVERCCLGVSPSRGGHAQGCSLWFPRVEEDLDQILKLGAEPKPKPQLKPKPPVAVKPALPSKPPVPPRAGATESMAGLQQQQQQQIQAMDEMDILQYIRDHDTPSQASPSLF